MPHLRTDDGVELFYRDWGAGQPVLFLHSMLMSSATWQYQLLHLADRGRRAVAYDRRGHGRSDDPGGGYDFDRLADDLACVIETLGLTDTVVVAHSMGGGELVRYLTHHGDQRISRIVLVGSTVPKLDVEAVAARTLLEQLQTGYGQWVTDNAAFAFGENAGSGELSQREREQAIREWMGVSLQAAVACTRGNLAADFRPELASITVPALVVHGDQDFFAPLDSCGLRCADLLVNGRLVVYPGASHMIHLTHRNRLNADLRAFIL